MAALSIAASQYPSRQFIAATEHDTNVLPDNIRGVLCLTAGNLVVDNYSDVEATIPLTAGMVAPISPKRLKVASTGTYLLLR